MSSGLFSGLFSPIQQLVGVSCKSGQSHRGESVFAVDQARRQRTQEAISVAAFLVSRLEKQDYAPAVSGLYKLSAQDRAFVAEKMLWINTQHRSIISSLPRFNCSFLLSTDGRKDLAFIQITHVGPDGLTTSNTFAFGPGTC